MHVIWNLTRVCPWNCDFCCVSAICARNEKANIICNQRKQLGQELDFDGKIAVLEMLVKNGCSIDFSGGDAMYFDEDCELIKRATKILPAEKINVSMTVAGFSDEKIKLLQRVGTVEFTLDNLPAFKNSFRPKNFNLVTMEVIKKLAQVNVNVMAVTVLHSQTVHEEGLLKMYEWLCENEINEWEVLRYSPVGRISKSSNAEVSNQRFLEIVSFLRTLKGYTRVVIQHSLKILEGKWECAAGLDSIGILPDGEITACAWALDSNCKPLDGFSLGKLPEDNLNDIFMKACN